MRFKKIYYVPGLISACVIPILFWFYGNRKLNEPVPNVMDIGLPARIDSTNEWSYKYSFENFRDWNFKNILVKPNTARANSEYYVSEIKKLQERNQKETGIEFIITNENSYDDFISILNDCYTSEQERYGVDIDKTGHFFVLVNYKDPNLNLEKYTPIDYGPEMDWEGYYRYTYQLNYENFRNNISQFPKQTFYLIFGFLIFLNISMFSIKESFQNH